jgi:uncharacterized protein YkwD
LNTKYFLLAIVMGLLLGACASAALPDEDLVSVVLSIDDESCRERRECLRPRSSATVASGSAVTGGAIQTASGAPTVDALYVVQNGDTLENVVQKYGVTVAMIVQRNLSSYPCLKENSNCLKTGAMIFVPRLPTLNIEMLVDANDYRDLRVTIMNGVNQYRRENKYPELAWDEALAVFTQNRSLDMAKRNYYSHFDPVTGASFVNSAGRTPACENLYVNKGGAAQSAVSGWINSPAHRTCILRDYAKVIGVGVSKDGQGIWYATMIAAN